MTVQKNGREVFNDSDINNPDIDGGTIDNATIAGGSITGITDLVVADGGTGASILTDHGVLLGSGTDPITALGAMTNGQLVIGSTGADPVVASITDGEGIDTTVGAGTLTIACEDATTSNKGVTVYSGSTKALAGTDTASAMTPADVAAKVAVDVNPRAMSQGVAMTYAASGSSGIQVADNDNIDFGTGNFTLVWKGSLPDWTPSATVYLKEKLGGTSTHYYGFDLAIGTTGKPFVNFYSDSSAVAYTATIAPSLVDGTTHLTTAVITRETASVAGSVVFYVDGLQLGASVEIAAASPGTLSNAGSLYVMGYATVRHAGSSHFAATYNRALTAAEVLDLYRNGIAFADKWGSQTAVYTSDFSVGVDGWSCEAGCTLTGNTDSINGSNDWLKVERTGAAGRIDIAKTSIITAGKRWKMTATIFNDAASAITHFVGRDTVNKTNVVAVAAGSEVTATFYSSVAAQNTVAEIFPCDASGNLNLSVATSTIFYVKNVLVYSTGATLALEPEGIQPAPGQWLDSSSNKLHAMQPTAGSSLIRSKKDFEYRWTNTWTASSAAQYVGGLNQAVLSADHFITDIITQATVTTDVENLTLGDGNTADKFVAAFAPSATRTKQTIAAQSDGTNLKLVYTPAAEATMTVETIIRGFIWEP